MAEERARRISGLRASLGSFSNFSQSIDLEDLDDPISAYFRRRCANTSKSFLKRPDSDGGSSFGFIDVDNISLFDIDEENERKSFRVSGNVEELKNNTSSGKITESKVNTEKPATDSELQKQRVLAQKVLKRLSDKSSENLTLSLESTIKTPERKESKALSDISSTLMNIKLSNAGDGKRKWLEPHFSPNTPRYFNDELSSFGGESETISFKQNNKDFGKKESITKRESLYVKKINSIYKEVPQIAVNSEFQFKTQTKEEQICQFEEDEKKFKLDNCGVLHNSGISEFSGTTGNEISQWPADNLKLENKDKNLSIGEFFNMRSNRVSSLVGGITKEKSMPNLGKELKTPPLTPVRAQQVSKSESSFPITNTPVVEKPKFRRCVSTCDLKETPEVAKTVRYSTDSCSSNGTAMIQDILAEMESGLSGTQMYEKLMKSCGRKLNERKEEKKQEKTNKTSQHRETPKSSKVTKEKNLSKSNKKNLSFQEPQKERSDFNCKNSVLSTTKDSKGGESPVNKILSRSFSVSKKEKGPTSRLKNSFCASTPKSQTTKTQNAKFKSDCEKALSFEGWDVPKVNRIHSAIDLNKTETSEENEKTITVNSSSSSDYNKKGSTITINETLTIEDTITAGDLTVLSQRIDELRRDSVCIVRSGKSEEPVLLKIIQKLANLPKGTLDCSALTPLIRDQFPELLSNISVGSKNSSTSSISITNKKEQDAFQTVPGSWIKLPGSLGVKEKLYACADVQKIISIPVLNISQNWVLLSIKSIELIHLQGKKLPGVKRNGEFCVLDFVVVSCKETIIPPDSRQSLKISFKSKLVTKLELLLTLGVKNLLNGEIQTRNVQIMINNVHPENYINISPTEPINFGVIADQCHDYRNIQISFDGICDLPLTIYIKEDDSVSGNFYLKRHSGHTRDGKYSNKIFHHIFHEGKNGIMEFHVIFQPKNLKEYSKIVDFKAELIIMLGSDTETDGILNKIPIKASVGFAKFLLDPTCCPLVFRSQKNQPVSRSLPIKNVGALPITFNIQISNEKGEVVKENDDTFVAPKTIYLPKNEEGSINITFNPSKVQNSTKRYLLLQIKPNGRKFYENEIIGIPASESKSPTSSESVSTKSTTNSNPVPVKLLTTTHSLSWTATPLDKEARQTLQVKSLSHVTISIRITFKINSDVFKFINENGERVHKMRKILKPDCPYTLTVAFRPDLVGSHHNSLVFESNHSAHKKMITLSGVGGIPNVYLGNVKSDLNGCKILRLQHSSVSNQFENFMTFKNDGRITGFICIKIGMKDFSLSHELTITPSSFIVEPNSGVKVKISQKLRNNELQQLLSGKEISKIGIISVVTGDEPSRQRLKKLVESGKIQSSKRLEFLTAPFHNETAKSIKNFKDSSNFEGEFLKSLKSHEVAIVIEKNTEILEPSILEETVDEFVTFMSTNENTVISTRESEKKRKSAQNSSQRISTDDNSEGLNESIFPTKWKDSKVTEWLETIDFI